jgi:pimeloyl-ACP methyl ester carboxylesterase
MTVDRRQRLREGAPQAKPRRNPSGGGAAGVPMETTSADETAIAFDRTGDGPALILVGGAFNDRRTPTALAAMLADSFAVYTYDRRGRGDSGDTPPYSVEREIEDLEAVIEAAGGSVAVYGHSSGAQLALETAARGLSVTKLAMYEPPYVIDESGPAKSADYLDRMDGAIAEGRRRDAVVQFMTESVGMPAEMVAGLLDSPMGAGLENLAHTLPYDERVMERYQRGRPLPVEWRDSVTVPALVMDGGNSPEWMRNACRALVRLLPDVAYRTLEGQDHRENPEAVAPVLERFLA